jgi:hypothetical protein
MDETKGSVHAGAPASNFRFDESPAEDVKLIHFHNFEKLTTAKGVAIDSPEFLCTGNSWKIALYPGGNNYSGTDMMAVYLFSTSQSNFRATFAINVKTPRGNDLDSKNMPLRCMYGDDYKQFDGYHCFDENTSCHGWEDYCDRESLLYCKKDVLKNGTLTLEVRIRPHSCTAV